MFAKQDEQFAESAVDPVRRRAAITDLTKRRTLSCCVAIFVGVLAVLMSEKGSISPMMVMPLFMVFFIVQINSDLRLLQVIEHLHKNGHLHNGATNVPNDPTIPVC